MLHIAADSVSHAWMRFSSTTTRSVHRRSVVQEPEGRVDELAIDDRPRQYPAHMPWATKDKDRRSGGDQEFALFHDKTQLVQKLDIGQRLMPAGVAFDEHSPVPTHGFRVKELLGIQPCCRLFAGAAQGMVPQFVRSVVSGCHLVEASFSGSTTRVTRSCDIAPSAGLGVPARQSERGHSQLLPRRPRVA